ncbi:MAG TPA: tetratricopeptide repeat protein [Acidimicrobiales bacterium]|nr:tetratricopeptide repeat protein [Acidimicrobiales bacterium]
MSALQLLSSFTPSTMEPEVLEAIFVKREPLAQRLEGAVRAAATTGDIEHHLVAGPRGMGKSHLLSIVVNRIRADAALADDIAVAWLREDEWGITSIGDLYEEIIGQLARDPLTPPEVAGAAGDALEALADVRAEDLADRAEELLPAVHGDRVVVVVVENLDAIFESVGTDDQHRLRAYLQNGRRTVLLASTPSISPSIATRKGLFFGFFAIDHLDELDVIEARDLLGRIATLRGGEDGERLVAYLGTDEAVRRLRVVAHLAGGHPRLWVLMSECITTERLEELVSLLLAVLDDLTPYYQAQMAALSGQQRKIVTVLARAEGALAVKDIARRARVKENVAAKQLGDLTKLGYVRQPVLPPGVEVKDKRTRAYELREPLLRHCLEVKESRGRPLRLVVEFLRTWYDRDRLEEWSLSLEPLAASYARAALEASEHERAHGSRAVDSALAEAADAISAGRPKEALTALATIEAVDQPLVRLGQATALALLGDSLTALNVCDEALVLDPNFMPAHGLRAQLLLRLGRPDEGLAAFDEVVARAPGLANGHWGRGQALYLLARYQEALAAFDAAQRADPRLPPTDIWRAMTLEKVGRSEDAALAYEEELVSGRADADAAAWCLVVLAAKEGVRPLQEDVLDQALMTRRSLDFVRGGLARLLDAVFENREEAEWGRWVRSIERAVTASGHRPELTQAFADHVVAQHGARSSPRAMRVGWRSLWPALLHEADPHDPLIALARAVVVYEETGDGAALLGLPEEVRAVAGDLLDTGGSDDPDR